MYTIQYSSVLQATSAGGHNYSAPVAGYRDSVQLQCLLLLQDTTTIIHTVQAYCTLHY